MDRHKYRYNNLNQCIQQIDRYGHTTDYQYDRLGNLERVTYQVFKLKLEYTSYNRKTYKFLGMP